MKKSKGKQVKQPKQVKQQLPIIHLKKSNKKPPCMMRFFGFRMIGFTPKTSSLIKSIKTFKKSKSKSNSKNNKNKIAKSKKLKKLRNLTEPYLY